MRLTFMQTLLGAIVGNDAYAINTSFRMYAGLLLLSCIAPYCCRGGS